MATLPTAGNVLAVIGQTVLYDGVPWTYVPGIGSGPAFWEQAGGTGTVIQDTHANRATYPAANYPQGTAYYETDRTVIYVVQNVAGVPTWIFFNGTYSAVYADMPALRPR